MINTMMCNGFVVRTNHRLQHTKKVLRILPVFSSHTAQLDVSNFRG